MTAGAITVDLDTREVTANGRELMLTRGEFHVLASLAQAPERAFSKLELCETQYRFTASPRWLDACVVRLRGKLAAAGLQDCPVRVGGHAYRLFNIDRAEAIA
jgi:DNA-binding response OmpR family regulator